MLDKLTTNCYACLSPRDSWRSVARTVLVLLLLMVGISPVTQSIWQGDNFLDGNDTETALIVGLTLASIAVLRMNDSRVSIEGTFEGLKDCISLLFGACCLGSTDHCRLAYSSYIPYGRGRPGEHTGYQLPLLI